MKPKLTGLVVTVLMLMLWVTFSNASQLPINRTLTIQLSSVDYAGGIKQVASTESQTDAEGKFTFSFPSVPSSDSVQYLILQVFDGSNMLRQSLVPAPNNGQAVEVGISETSDLQARILMDSGVGGLSPFRIAAALTMLRTTAISSEDVDKIAAAIGASTDAFYASLHAGGASKEQINYFNTEFFAGLRRVMSLYRKSVDDSSVSDTTIEAHGRYQAIALMMKELVSAGATAGIPLDVVEWAYMAAAGAAETSLEQQSAAPAVTSLVRMCFVNGMALCQTFRIIRSHTDALATLGISPLTLQKYFTLLDILSEKIPNNLRGIETDLARSSLSDAQTYEISIFNTFAIRDLAYFEASMDAATTGDFFDPEDGYTEHEALLAEVINRMAGMGGVMSGMTKTRFQSIMGTTSNPIDVYVISAWLYLQQIHQFVYTPIPNLASGVKTLPAQPLFNQLSGAYLAQTQLQYDLALIRVLNYQDDDAAQEASYLLAPARWYSLATAADLKRTAIIRRAEARANISGISEKEIDAIMSITAGIGGQNFF